MVEAHFAVPAAGGIFVTINTRLNAQEVGYILRRSGARFLFIDAELGPSQPDGDRELLPDAEALDAYSRTVSAVAERLAPSVGNLRVARRTRGVSAA